MAVSMTMGRDTKWLTLEVCREFQRGTCSRPDAECKFAHPSRSCHVENGRVIACFDSLKVPKWQTLLKVTLWFVQVHALSVVGQLLCLALSSPSHRHIYPLRPRLLSQVFVVFYQRWHFLFPL